MKLIVDIDSEDEGLSRHVIRVITEALRDLDADYSVKRFDLDDIADEVRALAIHDITFDGYRKNGHEIAKSQVLKILDKAGATQ